MPLAEPLAERELLIDMVAVGEEEEAGEPLAAAEALCADDGEGATDCDDCGLREAAGEEEPASLGELEREAETLRVPVGETDTDGELELIDDEDVDGLGDEDARVLCEAEGVPVGERVPDLDAVGEPEREGVRLLVVVSDGDLDPVGEPVGEREGRTEAVPEGDLDDETDAVGIVDEVVDAEADLVAETERVEEGDVVADTVGSASEAEGDGLCDAAGEAEVVTDSVGNVVAEREAEAERVDENEDVADVVGIREAEPVREGVGEAVECGFEGDAEREAEMDSVPVGEAVALREAEID